MQYLWPQNKMKLVTFFVKNLTFEQFGMTV